MNSILLTLSIHQITCVSSFSSISERMSACETMGSDFLWSSDSSSCEQCMAGDLWQSFVPKKCFQPFVWRFYDVQPSLLCFLPEGQQRAYYFVASILIQGRGIVIENDVDIYNRTWDDGRVYYVTGTLNIFNRSHDELYVSECLEEERKEESKRNKEFEGWKRVRSTDSFK